MESRVTFADMANPFQRIIRFVLTDFEPNANNERIPEEEADNVVRSALFSPIKIFYTRDGPKGHAFAEPIGVITSAHREDNKIVAEARIWETENEHVIKWIAEQYAANAPITVSWELMYDEKKSFFENGVRILRDIVMTGATIVANAAYGLRTSVLSFAENQGETMEESKELEELRAFRDEVVQKLEKARVFAERREKLSFIAEKHFDFVVSLSDEQFEGLLQFVADMPSRQASVSEVDSEAPRVNIPNFAVTSLSPLQLAQYLKSVKL